MANADRKHMSTGGQGKGDGTGAMTELPEDLLEENMVLSNRDKAQHSDERGLDSRQVQTEQYRDHAANRRNFDAHAEPEQQDGSIDSGGSKPSHTTLADGATSLDSEKDGPIARDGEGGL